MSVALLLRNGDNAGIRKLIPAYDPCKIKSKLL